jgi:nitrate/nitrite transport system ATP-binding protein
MKDRASLPIVTALTLSHNGSAITLSKELYQQGVRTLADFKQAIANNRDRVYTLGIVNDASMHNLMLRYWLAADGIDPDRDVNLVVISPSEMIASLKAGTIDGYCAGEPWNTEAVAENIGFVIATDVDIWPSYLEKVLGVREDWANQYPKTHLALIKALIEACQYCDDRRHRGEIAELIAQPNYLDTATEYIRPGFIEPYNRGNGEPAQMLPQYNEFSVNQTNFPSRVEGLWILVQMARWGIVPFPRNWIEVLDSVRRSDLYSEAARQLNLPGLEPERAAFTLFDGSVFNPDNPLEYLQGLKIKQEITVEEVAIESLAATP